MENRYATGAHNPFLPLGIYIPDGEPKVFDGRVYLYGSRDVFGGEYCCHKYHVYSAAVDDLKHWTDHGPALASTDEYADEGILDGVPWSDGLLWAPDVVERDGWYYLYFCLSDGTEGVARSRKPYGPFEEARQILMGRGADLGDRPVGAARRGRLLLYLGTGKLPYGEAERRYVYPGRDHLCGGADLP